LRDGVCTIFSSCILLFSRARLIFIYNPPIIINPVLLACFLRGKIRGPGELHAVENAREISLNRRWNLARIVNQRGASSIRAVYYTMCYEIFFAYRDIAIIVTILDIYIW